jgi:diaminopimelate epimerase
MRFTKMQGCGNDYVYVDCFAQKPPVNPAALSVKIADRHFGVGGDGLILIGPSEKADARMRMFNADGSEAEMCGNGVRCVARYLAERGAGSAFTVSTLSGPIGVTVTAPAPDFRARVDVGLVTFPSALREERVAFAGSRAFYSVSVGNPHAVFFVDDPDAIDLEALGTQLPGTNVHVARIVNDRTLSVRHFERGVGLTRACGTGAVACAAAATVVRGVRSPVAVDVPGGTLTVEWQPGQTARLTGPAETLYERTLSL